MNENLTVFVNGFLLAVMVFLAVMICLVFIRLIRGPRITDRIVSVNIIGSMTIMIIAILAFVLEQGYLVDICLIYSMISFLAVIVLTKVFTGVYLEKKQREKEKNAMREKKEGV